MTRLQRARITYGERVEALHACSEGPVGKYVPRGAARGMVAGTDLPFDELLEAADKKAAEQLVALIEGNADLLGALASMWRAGVITGVLFAQEQDDDGRITPAVAWARMSAALEANARGECSAADVCAVGFDLQEQAG